MKKGIEVRYFKETLNKLLRRAFKPPDSGLGRAMPATDTVTIIAACGIHRLVVAPARATIAADSSSAHGPLMTPLTHPEFDRHDTRKEVRRQGEVWGGKV